MAPPTYQGSRPRGGRPKVASAHGTKTISAMTSYALPGYP